MEGGLGRAVVAAAVLFCAGAAASRTAALRPLVEDVPVPGGIAALSAAVDAHAAPEPVRFAGELPRMIYEWVEGSGPAERRVRAVATTLRAAQQAGTESELVPIPLDAKFWSTAVFRRPIEPGVLVEQILTDRSAALLCRGLAGVDDETLAFLADHQSTVATLYEKDAGAFAAFADSLRVERGRVVIPEAAVAEPLWRSLLGASADDPAAFIGELFSRGGGRLAYLYDSIAHLDTPHRLFALGATIPEALRTERFKRLAAVAIASSPEWDVRQRPFGRASHDVGVLLRTVGVTGSGRLVPPAGRDFWARAFGHPAGEAGDADAAFLAEQIVTSELARRAERLQQVTFAQRVFGEVSDADGVLDAVSGYPRYPMLMLALERMRVRSPATYVHAVAAARQLSGLSSAHAAVALAQFQGSVALLVRAVEVRTLEPARAEALVLQLVRLPLVEGEYRGGVARWIEGALLPAFGGEGRSEGAGRPDAGRPEGLHYDVADGDAVDRVLEAALAGAPPPEPATVVWEDRTYTLDLAAPEGQRLHRVRENVGSISLAQALREAGDLARGDRRRGLARQADEDTAAALRALVYAIYLGDPDGPALLGGDLSARHDFGLDLRDNPARQPWLEPRDQIVPRTPRFVAGSLLNLDLALAPLALMRIDPASIVPPAMNPNDRDIFAQSVALMNPYELRNRDLDTIANGIAAGRARAAGAAGHSLDQIADELRLDGWRRQAMRWAVARRGSPVDFLSLPELVTLGDPRALPALRAWGTTLRPVDGCVCTGIVPPGQWQLFLGRPQFGLIATQVPDLSLVVAVALHERRLPAALARGVLAAAMQDYIDGVRPADNGDWLGLVRGARTITSDRMDDYIAALAAGGPLVPVTGSPIRGARP